MHSGKVGNDMKRNERSLSARPAAILNARAARFSIALRFGFFGYWFSPSPV